MRRDVGIAHYQHMAAVQQRQPTRRISEQARADMDRIAARTERHSERLHRAHCGLSLRAIRCCRRGSAASRAITRSPAASVFSASVVKRSEEHTSELQSLMRISYAVFCLK